MRFSASSYATFLLLSILILSLPNIARQLTCFCICLCLIQLPDYSLFFSLSMSNCLLLSHLSVEEALRKKTKTSTDKMIIAKMATKSCYNKQWGASPTAANWFFCQSVCFRFKQYSRTFWETFGIFGIRYPGSSLC